MPSSIKLSILTDTLISPVSVTLVPGAMYITVDGAVTVTVTVKVAAELVAAGTHVPLTTHSYIYPFSVEVALVRFKVDVVTFV